MIKNTPQKITVIAFNAEDRVTGDEANLFLALRKDDTHFENVRLPGSATEDPAGSGQYFFDLTAEHTNADKLEFAAGSLTDGVQVTVAPDNVIFTRKADVDFVKQWANLNVGVAYGDVVAQSIAALSRTDVSGLDEKLDQILAILTGSLEPEEKDVRRGIVYGLGDREGVYDPALEATVLEGTTYGANGDEFTGQYPASTVFVPTPVLTIDGKKIPARFDFSDVWQGDDYIASGPRVWSFLLDMGELDLTGASASIKGNDCNGNAIVGSASVNSTPDGDFLVISFDRGQLTGPDGVYPYDAEILAQNQVFTVLKGTIHLKKSQTDLVAPTAVEEEAPA